MTLPADHDPSHGFATTCWSRAALGAGDTGAPLAELCRRYRSPVYAYLRACSHPPFMAHDITQTFLRELAAEVGGRGAPHGQQFRTFLLQRLRAYLDADWRATRDAPHEDDDPSAAALEARYLGDAGSPAQPQAAFQRAFAIEVVLRALDRLRIEAIETGHGPMYDALAPYLVIDPGRSGIDALARALRTRPLVIVVALKRLRQRFREIAGDELADTVSSPDEFLAEQHALSNVLRGLG